MQKRSKISCQHVLGRAHPGELLDRVAAPAQIGDQELLRNRAAGASMRRRRRASDVPRAAQQRALPGVGHEQPVSPSAAASRRGSARAPAPSMPLPVAPRRQRRAVTAVGGHAGARSPLFADDDRARAARRLQHAAIVGAEAARSIEHHQRPDRPRRPRRRRPRMPSCSTTSRAVPHAGRVDQPQAQRRRRATRSLTRSRVVPAIGVTIARSSPTSALNTLDLPTLGAPAPRPVRRRAAAAPARPPSTIACSSPRSRVERARPPRRGR